MDARVGAILYDGWECWLYSLSNTGAQWRACIECCLADGSLQTAQAGRVLTARVEIHNMTAGVADIHGIAV